MRRRISYCQYWPSPNETASSTAALTRKVGHAQLRGGRGSRSAKARQIHAATTPSPYPIAAVTPQTSPWMRPPRGSSDGVKDRHARTSAPQLPGSVT